MMKSLLIRESSAHHLTSSFIAQLPASGPGRIPRLKCLLGIAMASSPAILIFEETSSPLFTNLVWEQDSPFKWLGYLIRLYGNANPFLPWKLHSEAYYEERKREGMKQLVCWFDALVILQTEKYDQSLTLVNRLKEENEALKRDNSSLASRLDRVEQRMTTMEKETKERRKIVDQALAKVDPSCGCLDSLMTNLSKANTKGDSRPPRIPVFNKFTRPYLERRCIFF